MGAIGKFRNLLGLPDLKERDESSGFKDNPVSEGPAGLGPIRIPENPCLLAESSGAVGQTKEPVSTRLDSYQAPRVKCPNCGRQVAVNAVSIYKRLLLEVVSKVERIAPRATELGWNSADLFFMRSSVDKSGLVGLLEPYDVLLEASADSITIKSPSGAIQRFYRRDYLHPWLRRAER